MRRLCILPVLLALLILTGCTLTQGMDGDDMENSYRQISQEEAKEMMTRDDGHVIVDVRRQDEYDAGHIPGAILIPNESITAERPAELPDLDQIILIYCRSGNRSKQAAQKLFDMGYTNIYEFGGINTWTGEVVTGGARAVLSFDSFDGGGPEYRVVLDSDIVSFERKAEYSRPDHEELDGAGFTVTFTFTGLKPGETSMTIEERSPIGINEDLIYSVQVDQDLNVSIDLVKVNDLDTFAEPLPTLVIAVNDNVFYAALEDNPSAEAFAENLSAEAIEVELHDYGDYEKAGALPWSLPESDEQITAEPGDVILHQDDQISICYDENTRDLTRLATIDGVSRNDLLEAFGDGNVTVVFWVEWSE